MGHGRRKCTLSHFQFITINFSHNSLTFFPLFLVQENFVENGKFLVSLGTWMTNLCACMPAHSCMTLCDPLDRIPPGSSVHGVFQERLLELVVISYSRGYSWPRDGTCIFNIGRQTLYHCATWDAGMTAISSVQSLSRVRLFATPWILDWRMSWQISISC